MALPSNIERLVAEIVSTFDATGFEELEGATNKTSKVAEKMGGIAAKAFKAIAVATAAAAVASVKLAGDYEASLTKINTLVGVAKDQTDDWGESLLAMAGSVGRGPKELADALFVVTSAGQKTADALDIVEQAAKASALGLGETKDVARAVTSAMNAYGKETLSAVQATDILTAIVREGNLEASELAPTLGRVVPIAAQLGVSFQEVGANIATFTRLGVDSSEAVTALRGVLNTLLAPTDGAATALKSVGLSAEGLKRQLSEEGLQKTLATLTETFGDNVAGLKEVIPNVRALGGVLGTAGVQGKVYAESLGNINDAAGIVNDGFEEIEKTLAFQQERFKAAGKAALIAFGEVMLPVIKEVVTALGDFAEFLRTDVAPAFKNLIDKAVREFNRLEPEIRPALESIKQLVDNITDGLREFWSQYGEVIKTGFDALFKTIAAGATGATSAISSVVSILRGDLRGALVEASNAALAFRAIFISLDAEGTQAIKNLADELARERKELALQRAEWFGIKLSVDEAATSMLGFSGQVESAITNGFGPLAKELTGFDTLLTQVGLNLTNAIPPTKGLGDAFGGLGKGGSTAAKALKDVFVELKPLAGLTKEQVGVMLAVEAAARKEEEAFRDLVFGIDLSKDSLKLLTPEQEALARAAKEAAEAARDEAEALREIDHVLNDVADGFNLAADFIEDFVGTARDLLAASGPWGRALDGALTLLEAFGLDIEAQLSSLAKRVQDFFTGGGTTPIPGGDVPADFKETQTFLQDELAAIDRIAEAMHRAGIEYDATEAKVRLLKSVIQELAAQGNLTTSQMQFFINMLLDLEPALADAEESGRRFTKIVRDFVDDIVGGGTQLEGSGPDVIGLGGDVLLWFEEIEAELERMGVLADFLGEAFNPLNAEITLLEEEITKLINEGLRPGNPLLDELIARYDLLNKQLKKQSGLVNELVKMPDIITGITDAWGDSIDSLGLVMELTGSRSGFLEDAIRETERAMALLEKAVFEGTITAEDAEAQYALLGRALAAFQAELDRLRDSLNEPLPAPPPPGGGGGAGGGETVGGTIDGNTFSLRFPAGFELIGSTYGLMVQQRDLLRVIAATGALALYGITDPLASLQSLTSALGNLGFPAPFYPIIAGGGGSNQTNVQVYIGPEEITPALVNIINTSR